MTKKNVPIGKNDELGEFGYTYSEPGIGVNKSLLDNSSTLEGNCGRYPFGFGCTVADICWDMNRVLEFLANAGATEKELDTVDDIFKSYIGLK